MIWGSIGNNYKSRLMQIKETVDSEKFKSIIDDSKMVETLLEDHEMMNIVFKQDRVICHNSKTTMQWLSQLLRLLNYPFHV